MPYFAAGIYLISRCQIYIHLLNSCSNQHIMALCIMWYFRSLIAFLNLHFRSVPLLHEVYLGIRLGTACIHHNSTIWYFVHMTLSNLLWFLTRFAQFSTTATYSMLPDTWGKAACLPILSCEDSSSAGREEVAHFSPQNHSPSEETSAWQNLIKQLRHYFKIGGEKLIIWIWTPSDHYVTSAINVL